MTDIIDLLIDDDKSSDISDAIKDVLFAKSSARIETLRPSVSSSLFDEPEIEDETTVEPEEESQEDG
tara:strand:+ start:554 stop:754 length:201 start_codon:yes stop_codon:yes gene_type:complete